MLPQVLQIILKVLSFVKSTDTISRSIKRIENSLLGLEDMSSISDGNVDIILRNAEVLTNQKDWLIWICDCLQHFDYSLRSGTAIEVSGGCLSDTSVNSYDRYPMSNPSTYGDDESSVYEEPLRTSNIDFAIAQYCDPLFNLVQLLLFIDIKKKPAPTRKYYDVFRLPLPEMHGFQVTILFDLLEAFENSSMNDSVQLH